MRSKFIAAAILTFGALLPLFAQKPPDRDLKKFAKGGSVEIRAGLDPPSEQERKRSGVREFLWNHWKNRVRGWIQVTFWSQADDPSTYDIYVEPREKERWTITVEYERQCCIEQLRSDPTKGIHFTTGTLYYYSLERRLKLPDVAFNGEDLPLDRPVYGEPASENRKLAGDRFVLLLRKESHGGTDWLF
jgi:hypothetical protein